MSSIVGFSLFHKLPAHKIEAALQVQGKALGYFSLLKHCSISVGETRLEVWGHESLSDNIHHLRDGSLLALIGSPLGETKLADIGENVSDLPDIGEFELPWEGRVILLLISADGKRWTMWNDWLGSIPVFHAETKDGRIASTLEPVTVAAAGLTPDDFFLPGLVSLLINGHFLSNWTLYKGMKNVPPDSAMEWDELGFRAKQLWTVQPSQSRWESGWDELVDEMHELSHEAIAGVLKSKPSWVLPLSSGLDSRLIAAVSADIGANVFAYAWGAADTTDVRYSRQIARTLGFPWKHIDLPPDFLVRYTPPWANWFGSALHFHGMYQMCFLDSLVNEPDGPVINGYIGEVLAGDMVLRSATVRSSHNSGHLQASGWVHWPAKDVKTLLKGSVEDAIEENVAFLNNQVDTLPGAWFQRLSLLELWNRQRCFISFQSTLSDYWRGVGTPFLTRKYARFCLSLPRAVLENRRLLADVYRRYYLKLAVIPGTYDNDPLVLTGSYLLKRRVSRALPPSLQRGSFAGLDKVPLRMDIEAIQATGRPSLWPLFEAREQLAEWLDVDQLEQDYQTIMKSKEDLGPLRRLQSVQTLAYRLLYA